MISTERIDKAALNIYGVLCPAGKRVPCTPFTHPETGERIQSIRVGCGKCIYCQGSIKKDWVFRMEWESRRWPAWQQHFVTLTYAQMPKNASLNYSHVQQYFKRLRYLLEQRTGNSSLKMVTVGEYGTKRGRPHWHIILWGGEKGCIEDAWTDNQRQHRGIVHVAPSNVFCYMYCMNYLDKSMYPILKKNPEWLGVQEMRHMSKGIGDNWLDHIAAHQLRELYETGTIEVSLMHKNKKLTLPRYLREKAEIKLMDDEARDRGSKQRIITLNEHENKVLAKLEKEGYSKRAYFKQLQRYEKIKRDKVNRADW